MNKKKIAIIFSVCVLILTALVIYSLSLSKDTPVESKEPEPLYVSMEDDGVLVTEDDIKIQKEIEDFARMKAMEYFKSAHPDGQSILIDSTEWYFTDESSNDNLLARASIISGDSSLIKDMIVLEISSSSDKLKLINTYKPDDRYSL